MACWENLVVMRFPQASRARDYDVISGCRSCGASSIEPILSLGVMPLTDSYLDAAALNQPEPRYPLDVAFCSRCALVQILETVSPELLFEDYAYYSSFSDTLLAHSRDNACRLIETQELDSSSLVVEIASNDGYMLRNFSSRGIPVLGIDPARGPAEAAEALGIPTLQEFFGTELAGRLRSEGKRADVVIANNVLAHVADLNGFVAGIALLLKDDGVAVVEVPYVKDLIERREFGTIYHEHLCYFSVTALTPLFARHGLALNRVEHHPIHGGSLRLYVGHLDRPSDSVHNFLAAEANDGMHAFRYYEDFASRVKETQDEIVALLKGLKKKGSRIAGYGAAAKGTVLLNATGIDREVIDFVVDRNVHKQGLYMPGVHIPIVDPSALLEEMPDYVLLLPWNFQDEIIEQQSEYRARGGRFIVPIPYPSVI